MASNLAELEHEVSTLQEALQTTRAQENEVAAVLTELQQRQQEAVTKAALARQAAVEYEQRLAELRARLEQARVEAATAAFHDACRARDEVARRAAGAIGEALTSLEELDGSRIGLAAMQEDLSARGVKVRASDDPDDFVDAWQVLVARVRKSIQEKLEDEMVEAAVYSSLTRAIDDLPVHLQELARQRRKRAQQQAAARAYSDDSSTKP